MSLESLSSKLTTSNPSSGVELLLNLLRDAAGGRDCSPVVPEIVEAVIGRPTGNVTVKKLVYELIKVSHITDSDWQRVIIALKSDLNSNDAELLLVAVQFMSCMPAHQLALMLETGDLMQLLVPQLSADNEDVRAAAVTALAEILMVGEVLGTAASSTAMANTCQEYWNQLSDMLLDEEAAVVGAAVSAVCSLLQSGVETPATLPEGFLVQRLASIAAARVLGALGPVLEMCQTVPSAAQVNAMHMLLLLVTYAHKRQGEGGLVLQAGSVDQLIPPLGVLVPTVCSYLMQRVGSSDAAVKLEACRSLLSIAKLFPASHGTASTLLGAAPQPLVSPTWIATAASTLLEMRHGQLEEAALPDVVLLLVHNLGMLPAPARQAALQRLWPVIGFLQEVPQRIAAYTLAWNTVVNAELEARATRPADAAMPEGQLALRGILAQAYFARIMQGHPAADQVVSTAAALLASAPFADSSSSPMAPPAPPLPPAPAPPPQQPQEDEKAEKSKKGGFMKGLFRRDKDKDKSSGGGADEASGSAAKRASNDGSKPMPGAPDAAKGVKQGAADGPKPPLPAPQPPPGPQQPAMPPAAALGIQSAQGYKPGKERMGLYGSAAASGGNVTVVEGVRKVPDNIAPFSTLRHELVCSLLEVVLHQPAAAPAFHLCHAAQSAALHNMTLPAWQGTGSGAEQARVLQWLTVAKSALECTVACVAWEPPVVPAVTTTVTAEALTHAAADFSSAAPDRWLQLMQAACHAVRALITVLQAQVQREKQQAGLPALQEGGEEAGVASPKAAPAAAAAGLSVAASQLAAAEQEHRELQQLIHKVLKTWSNLSKPVRARVLWVSAHYLTLPNFADETWEVLLRCMQDVLGRSNYLGAAARLSELMSSASDGLLLKTDRQSWPKDKPFVFDVVAASALCEKPEYELTAVVVGLSCAQQLVTLMQNGLAAAAAAVVAAAAAPAAAGSAAAGSVPDAAKVQQETLLLAVRMENLLRELLSTEVGASPQIKEWAKRIMRMCGAVASFVPPTNATEVAPDDISVSDAGDPHHDAHQQHQQQPVDDSSSDASSDYTPGLTPVVLPPSMYPPNRAPPPPIQPQPQPQVSLSPTHSLAQPMKTLEGAGRGSMAFSEGTLADLRARGAGATTTVTVVPPPPYLVKSPVGDCLWGYPFAGPRTSILFTTKRSRRHRAMADNLASALALIRQSSAPASHAADSGPALSSHTMYRLDSLVFWDSLPGHPEHWQELTGPADPVLLAGSYYLPGLDEDTSGAGDVVMVKLQIVNRLPHEVAGIELLVNTMGPVLAERRGIVWKVPRLSPGDRASHAFSMRLLGYGLTEVSCSMQMVGAVPADEAGPVQVHCSPLRLSMSQVLRPLQYQGLALNTARRPPALMSPADFFKSWSSLPARTEMTGVCVWTGLEGQLVALSGMLQQPLSCVLLQQLPASAGHQAGFAGMTAAGEAVMVMVTLQVVPPSAPGVSGHSCESVCHLYVRSSSPEMIQAASLHVAEWIGDMTGGAVVLGLVHPGSHVAARPKPPMHPRVAALHTAFTRSAARSDGKPSLAPASLAAGGTDALATAGLSAAGLAGALAGPKVGHRWMRNVALAEWQRQVARRG